MGRIIWNLPCLPLNMAVQAGQAPQSPESPVEVWDFYELQNTAAVGSSGQPRNYPQMATLWPETETNTQAKNSALLKRTTYVQHTPSSSQDAAESPAFPHFLKALC